MRRIVGSLALGLAVLTGSASRAEAQVNFNGTAYVCFEDALYDCNPDPTLLGGFGGTWSRFVNPSGTQLTFQGYGFNGTTDAVTGLTNSISFGDGQFFSGSFTGTFYLGMLFNTPSAASTLVFSGTATTQNNQLFVDFSPNVVAGTYGASSDYFFGELNDFSLTRGANAATEITGRLGVRPPSTSVPEPSTPLLLGAGLALLGVTARRPRRRLAA